MANDNNHKTKAYVAGDIRAGEHPGITSLHTLFVREHNRICDKLIAQGRCVQKRWGEASDVSTAVLALATGYFPYSTGQVIMVDGGLTLSRL